MREIEIKARVKDLDAILTALKQRDVELSVPVTQHDVVWGLPGVEGYNGDPWLRIRTETKEGTTRHIFTLKRSVSGQLDSIEHETEVSDPQAIHGMANELGFVHYTTITKIRQKAHFEEIELCIDSVESLGDFIEAEKLTGDDAEYEKVMDELWKLFKELGINYDDRVTDGYDTLIIKKLGKE